MSDPTPADACNALALVFALLGCPASRPWDLPAAFAEAEPMSDPLTDAELHALTLARYARVPDSLQRRTAAEIQALRAELAAQSQENAACAELLPRLPCPECEEEP